MDIDGNSFVDPRKGYELRSKLSDLADGLLVEEKVSFVFLLFKSAQSGLQIIQEILKEPKEVDQSNLFYRWMASQNFSSSPDWKEILAEALSILKNYKVAKTLNFTQEQFENNFLLGNNLKKRRISDIRKVLYRMCKDTTKENSNQLIALMESLEVKDINKSLEYYLMLWSVQGLINLDEDEDVNLKILLKCLQHLNLSSFVQEIEVVVEKVNCQIVKQKSYKSSISSYYQVIDEKNVGLCVIINEKNFSKCVFPKRWGTDKDVERLVEVFTAFGFTIELHSDLTYEQLVSTLGYYANAINDNFSFFVLIILSHGSENVIYTSDSIPVDMNTIEMMFQAEVCPKLIGKPKIFIVQSCQGEKWQKIMTKNDEPETDNFVFSKSNQTLMVGPQRGDSMVAWSTVQGFASFRDKHNGSWYIQELCKELWKFGDTFDLVEIFTRVNNNLRSKVHGERFMVPSLLLSLRAKIKFPVVKNQWQKGKKMMLQRLIFEKYFREFMFQSKLIKFNSLLKFQ